MKNTSEGPCVSLCATRRGPVLWLVLLILAQPGAVGQAATGGDVELLPKVARMLQENRGKIRYWQGRASVETTPAERLPLQPGTPESKTGLWRQRSSARFWYSADPCATRWSVSWESQYYDDNEHPMSEPRQETTDEMIKGKMFYRCMNYFKTADGKDEKGLTIWPAIKARQGGIGRSFDPMWLFTHQGRDTPEKLRAYSVLLARGHQGIRVWQEGPLVTLQEDFENQTTIKHTFDLSQGGNQVEYYSDIDPQRGASRAVWTYEKMEEVWVPKSWTYTVSGRPREVVRLRESVVNKPIPASEFALESLGVKPGMRVSDTTLGTTYFYEKPSAGPSDVTSEEHEVRR